MLWRLEPKKLRGEKLEIRLKLELACAPGDWKSGVG